MAKGFTFKQFHVNDHGCGMPVSTDGVMLGAWAALPASGQILDIGTGSGLLALMSAQRTAGNGNPITAIEIDSGAAAAAQKNFTDSPWPSRIELAHQSVQGWASQQPAGSVAAVVCNPPYFNHGEQADCQSRATARHTDTLSHHDLLAAISHLLAPTGTASLILPVYEGEQLIESARAHQLYCQRACAVKTTEHKAPARLLIALTASPSEQQNEQLVIHQSGGYSEAFIALTKAFYLKM
ncbi:tRNA1(Val) (adenine(37)-N6)-methyltransferase [Photobacterium rosenbergii]|uniref:tRNA1(Val) (adenine(37)-N6)-methyltransferase n=1 Tax=Photobacterium rosenbergii TaxID=294936 RepID=UPI001C99DD66|nr:methyltransferase [Photobacterium rosenbergii]MBY5948693.1 methyltransferase [Photobacterium rosenbergii]